MIYPNFCGAMSFVRCSIILSATTSILAGCSASIKSVDEMEQTVVSILASESGVDAVAPVPVALDAGFRSSILASVEASYAYRAALAAEQKISDTEPARASKRRLQPS